MQRRERERDIEAANCVSPLEFNELPPLRLLSNPIPHPAHNKQQPEGPGERYGVRVDDARDHDGRQNSNGHYNSEDDGPELPDGVEYYELPDR